jgi:DnaJ-class molecular chaperone
MLIHHPDKTSDRELIAKGMLIIEAYNTLVDPEKRRVYDGKLEEEIGKIGNTVNRYYEVVEVDKVGQK